MWIYSKFCWLCVSDDIHRACVLNICRRRKQRTRQGRGGDCCFCRLEGGIGDGWTASRRRRKLKTMSLFAAVAHDDEQSRLTVPCGKKTAADAKVPFFLRQDSQGFFVRMYSVPPPSSLSSGRDRGREAQRVAGCSLTHTDKPRVGGFENDR
ncbi:hypothetical protein BJX68DRAFT_52267 [Aspergillus pseudodeflectus]|uniref:Uncharacterized protein n=1 Tax=Aspergillus pseudodeflectus TaxID=176178 RepID=A0ABR4KLJ0_9EURO